MEKGLPQRRLTIRECARLQTFPDDYQFILPKTEKNVSVNASNAYKLIGNAVPCILAFNIAMSLAEKWTKYFLKTEAKVIEALVCVFHSIGSYNSVKGVFLTTYSFASGVPLN